MTDQRGQTKPEKITIFTIWHSTRAIGEFIELLRAYGIELLADIRTIPKSRHNPQFNKEELGKNLHKAGIGYLPMPGLGGLRHAKKDSPNTGWENASFRGFADYMQTEEFRKSLEELIRTAQEQHTAIMCAEAVPWRCHRSLIADALSVRRIKVMHIMSSTSLKGHQITPWANVTGLTILYLKS